MKKVISFIRNFFIYTFVILNLPLVLFFFIFAKIMKFLILDCLPKYYYFLSNLLMKCH